MYWNQRDIVLIFLIYKGNGGARYSFQLGCIFIVSTFLPSITMKRKLVLFFPYGVSSRHLDLFLKQSGEEIK
jgi:hypothetical protein